MALASFLLAASLIGTSLALPIDVALSTDYDYWNSYYQPCLPGLVTCRPSILGNILPSPPLGVTNPGLMVASDVISTLPYPRSVDIARENYVRSSYIPTEYGVRDEVTIRPGVVRPPYSRPYSLLAPTYVRGINRYPVLASDYDIALSQAIPVGLGPGTASVLAGDGLIFKK